MIRRYGTQLRAAMMLADVAFAAILAVALSDMMFRGTERRFWADWRCSSPPGC